jgi:transcriptional regulator with XRE-family HTH domain
MTSFIYDLEEKIAAMADIRKRAGKTQQDAADLLGVDKSLISRWETGASWPEKASLIRLTRLLDLWQMEVTEEEPF